MGAATAGHAGLAQGWTVLPPGPPGPPGPRARAGPIRRTTSAISAPTMRTARKSPWRAAGAQDRRSHVSRQLRRSTAAQALRRPPLSPAPAGGALPVNGFWSLSMYEVEPDGKLFFTPNPIGRYAIGDRTAGLKAGPDGAIDIVMQRDAPADPAQRATGCRPRPATSPGTARLRAQGRTARRPRARARRRAAGLSAASPWAAGGGNRR